jgi:hypothetical protein
MRRRWRCQPPLLLILALLCWSYSVLTCAAEDKVYARPDTGAWNFSLLIENTTGHEIHLRILENHALLGEVCVSGETISPVTTPDGRPMHDLQGGPLPSHYRIRPFPIAILESTKELRIEETEFLKTARTFDISTFTSHPEADFRLRVSKEQGLALSQDFFIPPNEDPPEDPVKERKQPDAWRFVLLNKSGKPIDLRVSIDGDPVFEKHLDASLPPSTTPPAGFRPDSWVPDVPAFVVAAPGSRTAKNLVVEEKESLHISKSFDVHTWATQFGAYVLEVDRDRITFTPGFPLWAHGAPHMP